MSPSSRLMPREKLGCWEGVYSECLPDCLFLTTFWLPKGGESLGPPAEAHSQEAILIMSFLWGQIGPWS